MNKPQPGSLRNIGLSFLAIVALMIIAAYMPAEYSLSALMDNSVHAAHTAQAAKELPSASESFEAGWRYTKNGWQNRLEWEDPAPVRKPALHPAVVVSLQLLISLAALIWFSTKVASGKRGNSQGGCSTSNTH